MKWSSKVQEHKSGNEMEVTGGENRSNEKLRGQSETGHFRERREKQVQAISSRNTCGDNKHVGFVCFSFFFFKPEKNS